jgi:calcineurin-like phosphoesterase family protein
MNWYTADLHFGHDMIIEYCRRPYQNAKKMEIDMVRKYRKVVDPDKDTVYIIGDLTLAGIQHQGYVQHIITQLPGRKIFIMGNHDKLNPFIYVELGIQSVHTSLDTGKYILHHDPAAAIMAPNRKWLCGHVHTIFKKIRNIVNVGVDQHGFFPVNEEEIDKLFADERDRI